MKNQIKKLCFTVKNNLREFFESKMQILKRHHEEKFGNTDQGVYYLLLLIIGVLGGASCLSIGFPKWFSFFFFGALSVGVSMLIIKIGTWFISFILQKGIRKLLVLSLSFLCIYRFCMSARMGIVSEQMGALVAVAIFFVAVFFIKCLYAILFNKKRNRTILVLCIASGLLFSIVFEFLFGEGFEDAYVTEYLELAEANKEKRQTDKNTKDNRAAVVETKNGTYETGIADYGTKLKRIQPTGRKKALSIESKSISLASYIGGYEGFDAIYRTWYQGYDEKSVPLSGRIWYPKDKKNCPVLFIIHGNHSFTTQSYLGYAYLGKYLASHGYVVVSVDENFLNGNIFGNLVEENDARAVLLLENIKQVLAYNKDEENPLYNLIDEEKIVIAGHSRGGEAVATAAYFNKLTNYPEDGTINFHYDFDIHGVIAIAPTVDQYQPTDRSVELKDINYLLLHGANDQDVSVFMGMKQYNNVGFSGKDEYFKSYLYIAGANHGQFNTLWGKYDLPSPLSEVLNVENLLSEKKQQKILKIFTKEFLDATLLGDKQAKKLFAEVQKYEKDLPKTVYIQGYQDSSYEMVCDFEEDLDITTGTMQGTQIDVSYVDEWTEKLSRYSKTSYRVNKDDYALSINWSDTLLANVEISIPEYDVRGKGLSFDILDMDNYDVKVEEYQLVDATILLEDDEGRQATATISDFCTVYPPLPIRLSKMQFLLEKNEYKHQFQTVIIPTDAFVKEEGFDEKSVAEIKFLFNKYDNGKVRIDNIAFVH